MRFAGEGERKRVVVVVVAPALLFNQRKYRERTKSVCPLYRRIKFQNGKESPTPCALAHYGRTRLYPFLLFFFSICFFLFTYAGGERIKNCRRRRAENYTNATHLRELFVARKMGKIKHS